MRLLQVLQAALAVAVLQADKRKGKINLSRRNVVSALLVFEESLDHAQVLQRLLVEVVVNLAVHGILTSELLQVLLHDKLLPDLGDLAVEAACLGEGALDSEKLAHVEVTAT